MQLQTKADNKPTVDSQVDIFMSQNALMKQRIP